MSDLIADELNVKEVALVRDAAALSETSYKPDFKRLGPRFGKNMKAVKERIENLDAAEIERLGQGEGLAVPGGHIELADLIVQRREREDLVVAIDNNLAVGLDIQLDDELVGECTARELVNRVQNMRKEADLAVSDRIVVGVCGPDELEGAVKTHKAYIAGEVLAVELTVGTLPTEPLLQQQQQINGHDSKIGIEGVKTTR